MMWALDNLLREGMQGLSSSLPRHPISSSSYLDSNRLSTSPFFKRHSFLSLAVSYHPLLLPPRFPPPSRPNNFWTQEPRRWVSTCRRPTRWERASHPRKMPSACPPGWNFAQDARHIPLWSPNYWQVKKVYSTSSTSPEHYQQTEDSPSGVQVGFKATMVREKVA